jgi:hypothetical protein
VSNGSHIEEQIFSSMKIQKQKRAFIIFSTGFSQTFVSRLTDMTQEWVLKGSLDHYFIVLKHQFIIKS